MNTIRLRRGLKASWSRLNPVLAEGELGAEIDTGQVKVGDGFTSWNLLPYSGEGSIALQSHIESLTPHPVYDDGPSLTLLYENAKV
jgi:hypothetical protein